MKFTDGYWQIRPGFHPHYAAEAYQTAEVGKTLRVLATTHPIRHRGDTLQGPNLTIEISSPQEEVARVKITHFAGKQDAGPHFEIADSQPEVEIQLCPEEATLQTGKLQVRVDRRNWGVRFQAEGKNLTQSSAKGIGYIQADDGKNYLHEQLQLGVGELVYGLGERFTAFAKNGQTVEIWNRDGGTGSEQAYKNIPFYLTNAGYGVFVNEPGRVEFEVASEKVSKVQFSVEGESLEYLLIYGPTPKEILEKYTSLTGRPALPPAWTFGLWLTTSFTTNYDEKTVASFLNGMAERELPLHVFHFDCFWMRAFSWCDFEWDPEVFPDPAGMLKRMKERDLHISVWINPYIGQQSKLFEEGNQGGYFLRRENGDVWQWDKWQPGMAIVDFTNPDACRWYASKLENLLDMGVDSFKTDFGERIPTDAFYHSGADPERMHNYYTLLYNECVFNVLKAQRGEGEAAVFARSATAGGQKFPVHWGGDCYSDFPSMAESLRGGLSLGLCGFGFWSHDIGGFEGMPRAEIYKRWIAFGLMSSHSRLHGSTSYRVPWLFDEEACDALRAFTNLKCRLMPYVFQKAVEAHSKGVPVMRAMLLEFPEDPACHMLDRQYMLGEALLVAPVFSESGSASFYLPEGRWTDWFSGRETIGPRWVTEEHGFLTMPLWVRPGTALPLGTGKDRPDYEYATDLDLRVFALEEGQSVSVSIPDPHGVEAASATVTRRDGYSVWVEGELPGLRVTLVNVASRGAARDCSLEKTALGTVLLPQNGAKQFGLESAQGSNG
jgi:alpha-D-xyloside xylohydrolase